MRYNQNDMTTDEDLAKAEMKAGGKPLQKMFNQVPEQYDQLNRLMTFRMDEIWRRRAVQEILREHPSRVMDLGTGTGDMAIHIAKKVPEVQVTGYDFSAPMMEVAERKFQKFALRNLDFVEGDAAEMPFEKHTFDVVGISFAFRNMTYRNKNTSLYLQEILRVLKPGGKMIAVESSQPKNRFIRFFFRFYLQRIVSGLGSKLGSNKGAYHYLAYSAINYYTPEELTALLQENGFGKVKHKQMFFGAAAITYVQKPY